MPITPNRPRFSLTIPSLPAIQSAGLAVLSFQSLVQGRWATFGHLNQQTNMHAQALSNRCGQHGLSEHYLFEFHVQSQALLDPNCLLGKKARFRLDDDFFHGHLSTITCLPSTAFGHRYCFRLASPIYPLTQITKPKVFIDKAVPEIIETCLGLLKWQKGACADYQLILEEVYPPLRAWVQAEEENDWAHLERLLRTHGVFFYFVQNAERATLIFRDRLPKTAALEVSFKQDSQALLRVQALGQVQRASTVFSVYNPDMAHEPWIAEQPAQRIGQHNNRYGRVHTHGSDADSQAANARLAKIRQESLDWQSAITVAHSTLSGLQPGQALYIHNHPIAALNQAYTIVDIVHEGDQSGAYLGTGSTQPNSGSATYQNHLMLIPQGLAFRKYDGYMPRMQAPLRGRLESLDARPEAPLDEAGFYHFRYPFDRAEGESLPQNPLGMASPKTAFTQLMGSAGQGLGACIFPANTIQR